MYPHGLIGNCQAAALVNRTGAVDWCCLPRPDSEPLFGALLDAKGGHFRIAPLEGGEGVQSYIENTNVLVTRFVDQKGNVFTVTDFFPRFEQYSRMYRPCTLIRIVTPVLGHAQVVVSCKPVAGWSKHSLDVRRGNSHLRFEGVEDQLRLTTNMPLTYLQEERPIALNGSLYFALTWGAPIEEDIEFVCKSFLDKTIQNWRTWIKHCSIPVLFQKEVIRSALTLKLHCYEDTGAILAAITTSLPEEAGGVRNWDYRFCWLRDAYFSVSAFYKLGHFEEMEGILNFLFNILQQSDLKRLHPVYRLDCSLPLPELTMENWEGYHQGRPVRSGNQAAEHVQNDVYGEMLLTVASLYFDERFLYMRAPQYDELMHLLAERCYDTLGECDAGIWELRGGWKPHSFTHLMSWAGLERYLRLIRLGKISGDPLKAQMWLNAADVEIRKAVTDEVLWNCQGERIADASSLLLASLRYHDQSVVKATVDAVWNLLGAKHAPDAEPAFFYRYKSHDDFGVPQHAFLVCSFWMVEALAKSGQQVKARSVLETLLSSSNHLGLFAEHYDPETHTQRGNFPQCYSHVGMIHGAFAVSPSWDEVL
jgi:GH15 family glucan-1,4-alpha-glucosidase